MSSTLKRGIAECLNHTLHNPFSYNRSPKAKIFCLIGVARLMGGLGVRPSGGPIRAKFRINWLSYWVGMGFPNSWFHQIRIPKVSLILLGNFLGPLFRANPWLCPTFSGLSWVPILPSPLCPNFGLFPLVNFFQALPWIGPGGLFRSFQFSSLVTSGFLILGYSFGQIPVQVLFPIFHLFGALIFPHWGGRLNPRGFPS